MPKLTNRLRVLRAERRMSQMALGRRVGISQARISSIENGYAEPSANERKKIARTLKVTVADAFPDVVSAAPDTKEAMAS
jgi:putative transcriptional regulator